MTGPTGADQRRPGELDVDEALAVQTQLYSEHAAQAALAALAEYVARERRGDHPDPPPPGR